MKRVTGIGGVFFKSENPEKSKEWYRKHLGIQSGQYGGTFEWRHAEDEKKKGFTAWGPFDKDTDYFAPSKKDFMYNYRVDDLEALLKVLEEEGVEVVGEMEVYDYGKFGWIMDPDGQKIELWEPNDSVYENMADEENNTNKSS
ncbi:VOC family protein [Halalkalibaculum roseum]|nr:VOC family protein [Halalkalibaculum roseum]